MSYSLTDLLPGARTCVSTFAKVSDADRVVILSDNPLISDAIAAAISERAHTGIVDSIYLSPSVRPVKSISKVLAGALKDASVVFSILSVHDDELEFRKAMLEFTGSENRRIYHMLGVNEETLTGKGALGLTEDEVQKMESLTSELAIALTLASKATIKSPLHSKTDLELILGSCENTAAVSTGRVQIGTWGNLPSGEAFILPISASGKIVIDKAIGGLDLGFSPYALEIVDSRVIIESSSQSHLAEKLAYYEELARRQNLPAENVRRVCEFGIGTNPKAKPVNLIEIEKILGTVHIALGTNTFLGGKIKAPNHTDMVINQPTVMLDNKLTIIQDGKLNERAVRDFPLLNHSDLPANQDYLSREVKRFPERVREDGECLYRVWLDKRRNRLEVPIGSKDTAQLALAVWQGFGNSDVQHVQRLAKTFNRIHGGGDSSQDTLLRILGVLERFCVVSSLTPSPPEGLKVI